MRVAFDIGGTFTDVIIFMRGGQVRTAKMLSLHQQLGADISAMIDALDGHGRVDSFVHATTVCSNALIERTLPRVAFLTTQGFRHLLEMMGQRGPTMIDLYWERLPPLVPLEMCFEVAERVLASGVIDSKMDEEQVGGVLAALESAGVASVAVCLVNSYVNSAHEVRLRELIARRLPKLSVCLSSDVDPEIKEFERASTTVINAALVPVVNQYLDLLQADLDRYSPSLRIMQSNGGTMSSVIARQRPMTMVESGPAAGVLAASCMARELGIVHVLSFDMGGTTAKACLVEDGRPMEKHGMEVGGSVGAVSLRGQGHPLRAPSLDIVEVGAGGGSIAWVDAARTLRVGPRSAGADPGPACYSKGGVEPTVTDANVALGHINPDTIADSTLAIDRNAALKAIETRVAAPLGLDVLEAAQGIVDVANATMMRALRAVSTERGRDIREVTLLAFGGSGPVHAVSLSERVGISKIVVPPLPGVFSALGLLLAGDRMDYVQSQELPLDHFRHENMRTAYEAMLSSAIEDLKAAGLSHDKLLVTGSVDIRYSFEPHELNLPIDFEQAFSRSDLLQRFEQAHLREYGFAGEGEVHVARLRIQVTSPVDRLELPDLIGRRTSSVAPSSATRSRSAYFGRKHGLISTQVVDRSHVEGVVSGPLIIEEQTSTVVLLPGWSARRDALDNLLIERDAEVVA